MPSAEDILRARDSEDVAAPEREETRIPTDYPEQKPSQDQGEGDEPKPRREIGDPRPEPESDEDGGSKMVPQQALHAEREKSKRYTEEVRDLHQKIAELTSIVQRAQQPQPEPQKPPEFDWDNPIGTIDQRMTERVEARIAQERQAIAAEFQRQREAVQSQFAITRHGEEAVKSAYVALAEARGTDPQWAMDYQRIMRSPDQYEAMVQWHKQRTVLAEIGTDPDAYKERIRAEYLQELRHGKTTLDEEPRATARSPGTVMPSNLSAARSVGSRNGPAWQGPTSIKDIFANR